jgi:hypothetical protein
VAKQQSTADSNPFAPPTAQFIPQAKLLVNRDRKLARWSLLLSYLFLAIAAVFNNWAFLASIPFGMGPRSGPFVSVFDVSISYSVTALIVVTGFGIAWFFLGLGILETLTRVLHSVFSKKETVSPWIKQLHIVCKQSLLFALPGALLWVFWVYGFYFLEIEFYALSVPVGVAAHVLAAGFYLQLFVRWFLVERAAALVMESE